MASFPRALFYRGVAGEMRLVHSDEEDAAARAEGWLTFGEFAGVLRKGYREASPEDAEAVRVHIAARLPGYEPGEVVSSTPYGDLTYDPSPKPPVPKRRGRPPGPRA